MADISSVGEAVARVAYASSDVVVSVQPSLQTNSEFSRHLRVLSERKVNSHVSGGQPEILSVRHNADPFLSAFLPISQGKLVSITTASSTLLGGVPHLYKLANYPIVIHVSLNDSVFPDYSDITAIRQCGFTFLQSETLQEAQDMSATAHALAIRSGKGVVHFFDPTNAENDDPIKPERKEILDDLLDTVAIQAYHGRNPNESSLYVDDGHQFYISEVRKTVPLGDGKSGSHAEPPRAENPKLRSIPISKESLPRPPVHNGSADIRPTSPSATSVESVVQRPVSSEDILGFVQDIWFKLGATTGRHYHAFEYTGYANAETVLLIFGSTGMFVDELRTEAENPEYKNLGLLTARLYRPWLGQILNDALPASIKRIAVLEQVRRKTTKWGPVLMDVLMSVRSPQTSSSPLVVGHQLGHLEPATIRQALRGILHNLKSANPIQNLEVGSSKLQARMPPSNYTLEQPKVEKAYLKILDQLFGQRLYLANRLGATNAGVSTPISASPEYGLGSLIARIDHKNRFISEVQEAVKSKEFTTDAPKSWLAKWVLNEGNTQKTTDLPAEVIARLSTDGSQLASNLLSNKALFFNESRWLVGSDAWAYDLANSGVHHVLASEKNINMLIIDSQPFSDRASSDHARRKKDIGLYAMNFGNAYVASVAVYGSYTQVLEAMIEADRFDGPSVVLAYLPYNKENDSPLTVLQETKKAIDIGYWPLYRWNPHNAEKGLPDFQLDSERIRKELEEFLKRDNHLSLLMKRHPQFSANLSSSYGTEIRVTQKRKAKEAYERMLEGLYGAPLTVLFASDNGNAEGLAKRLGIRGKYRGLKTIVMAMDDYPIEDLSAEENVVIITSTAGQGELPQNGRAFWAAVKENGDLDLQNVNYSVFALGDSHYWPRKEDRIYYNKPGKDLDARISFLGAKCLADIGLGDDQDPDGYQTGYAEWEPKLWKALNVDNVEGEPEEPPPITNEDIKIESNYLRGTIQEGLEDKSTGAIAASDQQLTKFHGTYMQDDRDLRDQRKAQGMEPAYSFMIRCRLNGGIATPSQWLQMDKIASDYGNGTMKLTTRQTFQFHGVIKGRLKLAMRGINKALMTTLAACGDVNRNVMVSTLPTQSAYHKDVHQISAKISDHLLPATTAYHEIWIKDENDKKTQVAGNALVDHEPLYGPTYLPRKFKITIAIPPHNDTDVYAHDVGLIAIKNERGRLAGFNFLVGGGMGVTHNNKKTYPRTGSMFGYASAEKAHLICEKIMLVQRDNGDRKNRKHARLKYTIDDMGVEVFKSKVEALLEFSFESPKPFQFDSNIDTFGWQRDEEGRNHFTMFIENGRVEDTPEFPMKTGLRDLATELEPLGGELRLTGNQHLCVSNVPDSSLSAIKSLLAKYKLDNLQHSALRLSSSACVAFPTCGLAMAESERYLPLLISKLEACLEENGLRHDSLVMRMTGCPNGCARPWLAEAAFVGKAYGAYNMYLGGGYHGNRLNKLYRSSIGEEEILEIMKGLLGRWAREREEGEHFGDFVIRVGIIKRTTEGKTFHDEVAEDESDEGL